MATSSKEFFSSPAGSGKATNDGWFGNSDKDEQFERRNTASGGGSIITIVSILAAVGCYVGAANDVPLITPTMKCIAGQVYAFCPVPERFGRFMPRSGRIWSFLRCVIWSFSGLLRAKRARWRLKPQGLGKTSDAKRAQNDQIKPDERRTPLARQTWRQRPGRGEAMLRITMSVSAEGAQKYFDAALNKSDYYTREQGIWGGKGAESLGLRGEVRREDFLALASNRAPGKVR
jgi:hypothetical protein